MNSQSLPWEINSSLVSMSANRAVVQEVGQSVVALHEAQAVIQEMQRALQEAHAEIARLGGELARDSASLPLSSVKSQIS